MFINDLQLMFLLKTNFEQTFCWRYWRVLRRFPVSCDVMFIRCPELAYVTRRFPYTCWQRIYISFAYFSRLAHAE